MRRGLCLAALPFLAACAAEAGPESADAVTVTAGPIRSVEELDGTYRVAELADIDMAKLDRGISVTIARGRIDVLLHCVNVHWDFGFESERLFTHAVEDHEPCRRAQMVEEAAIEDAFNRADRVSRTSSNGISFEGSGRSVTLFSQ